MSGTSRPTPFEKADMIRALERALTIVRELPESRECRDCDNLMRDTDYCAHWNADVPADTQAVGCDDWRPLIPF
jgi:hypothetical protein